MGKPSPIMLRAGLAGLDVPLDRCLMVGDRLATDIRMALDAGMPAAVVFTGETRPQDMTPEYDAAFRLDHIDELVPVPA